VLHLCNRGYANTVKVRLSRNFVWQSPFNEISAIFNLCELYLFFKTKSKKIGTGTHDIGIDSLIQLYLLSEL